MHRRGFFATLAALFITPKLPRFAAPPTRYRAPCSPFFTPDQRYFLDPQGAWSLRVVDSGEYAFGFSGFTAVDGPMVGLTEAEAQRLIDDSTDVQV